jgi:hypothetical protein
VPTSPLVNPKDIKAFSNDSKQIYFSLLADLASLEAMLLLSSEAKSEKNKEI